MTAAARATFDPTTITSTQNDTRRTDIGRRKHTADLRVVPGGDGVRGH